MIELGSDFFFKNRLENIDLNPETGNNDQYHIYYINMKKQIERNNSILAQMKRAGVKNVTRYEGIVGQEALEHQEVKNLLATGVYEMIKSGQRAHHYDQVVGSLGCYLSHIAIWMDFYVKTKNNGKSEDYLFVLEDDVYFPQDTITELNNAMYQMEKIIGKGGWDIFVVGNKNLWGPVEKEIQTRDENEKKYQIFKPTWYTGMGGYILKKNAILKLMEFLFPIRYQLDWQLAYHRHFINIYSCFPFVVNLTQLYAKSEVNHVLPIGEQQMREVLAKSDVKFAKMKLPDIRGLNADERVPVKILYPPNEISALLVDEKDKKVFEETLKQNINAGNQYWWVYFLIIIVIFLVVLFVVFGITFLVIKKRQFAKTK